MAQLQKYLTNLLDQTKGQVVYRVDKARPERIILTDAPAIDWSGLLAGQTPYRTTKNIRDLMSQSLDLKDEDRFINALGLDFARGWVSYDTLEDLDGHYVSLISPGADWYVAMPSYWTSFSGLSALSHPLKTQPKASDIRVSVACHEIGHVVDPLRKQPKQEDEHPAWSESFADCFGLIAASYFLGHRDLLDHYYHARQIKMLEGESYIYATGPSIKALRSLFAKHDLSKPLPVKEMVALAQQACDIGLNSIEQPSWKQFDQWRSELQKNGLGSKNQNPYKMNDIIKLAERSVRDHQETANFVSPYLSILKAQTEELPSHPKSRADAVLSHYRQKLASLMMDSGISDLDKKIALFNERQFFKKSEAEIAALPKNIAKIYRKVAPILDKETYPLFTSLKGASQPRQSDILHIEFSTVQVSTKNKLKRDVSAYVRSVFKRKPIDPRAE